MASSAAISPMARYATELLAAIPTQMMMTEEIKVKKDCTAVSLAAKSIGKDLLPGQ
jgi:hypothetical protein